MATIHVLPLRMNLIQNLKCQTGNSFCFYSENFRRRTNNTNVFFIQKLPGVNVQDQEFPMENKCFQFITLKTFGEEWTTKRFSSSKSHQALTCENKSFTLKAYGAADRITPKSEVSNWRLEKLSGEEQQNVFFIEKLPSVNVRNQEFSC
jgi:hypothetical protein